ncbi:MAG: helix-turn-helix domain-containing protein [Thioclava marina]|uniref:helix-turn-helix transcriptional regulator n=1 Tax=Thioclava marina TaxID=1915077 RepID=UPI0019969EFC|nr:helix-turn-helix domain-containing protein [Thioclava marina]MBC7146761.1 helix-turn-helix domain-containing protein [Thioclava marina]
MSQSVSKCSAALLTQADVAARLKISQRQLQRMVAAGHFPPPMKVGAQNRWSEGHLEDYIADLADLAKAGPQEEAA